MKLRAAIGRRRLRSGKMSRRTAIPALAVVVLCAVLIGKCTAPYVPYWIAGNPGVHARAIPENALAHLQVDLKKAAALPVPEATRQRIADAVGLSPATQPGQWAGRYASATMLPREGYLVMIDVRDHDRASASLFRFLSAPGEPVRELWDDRLVIASSHDVVREVRQRQTNPNLTTLSATELYRHAILNRAGESNPAAFYFIRSQALTTGIQETAALLSGCSPDAYLFGTIAADRQGNLTTAATCPRLRGGEPEGPAIKAVTPIPAAREPNLVFSAAFAPTKENITDQIVKIGAPGLPNPLAGLAKILDQLPGAIPDADPANIVTRNPGGSKALKQITDILDGTITVTYAATPGTGSPALTARLGHKDADLAADTITRLAGKLNRPGVTVAPGDGENEWTISAAGPGQPTTITTIRVTPAEIVVSTNPEETGNAPEPWKMPVVPEQGYHTMLYLSPHEQETPLAGWWEAGYWMLYTSTRHQDRIEHRLTTGTPDNP